MTRSQRGAMRRRLRSFVLAKPALMNVADELELPRQMVMRCLDLKQRPSDAELIVFDRARVRWLEKYARLTPRWSRRSVRS